MKKTNFIKRALVAATFALAVAVLVPATGTVDAQAAPKKVTANKNYKKAPSIKINKTYKVTSKTKGGKTFVKFKAPKTGTYVFTISNVKTYKPSKNDDGRDLANFYIKKMVGSSSYKYLGMQQVKTQGGKATCINMCTPGWYKKYPVKKAKTGSNLQKRTATIKIKKNEVVYVNMSYYTGKDCKCTYELKVKKK
ncbi:MAG: hypothetical protein IJ429_05950 [Lachnospiraceae bacterium]|nr:hypothetical protein [Lachnospiraceae bacterium]